MKNQESKFNKINKLIGDVESSLNPKKVFSDIDSLSAEVDKGVANRKEEVAGWSIEQKREFAVDGDDPYVLNLLSMDEDFNVRSLAFCNPNISEDSMMRVLDEAPDYIRMIIAHNPSTPSAILDRLIELTNEPEVLNPVKEHPNASKVTKYKIEERMG